MSNLPIFYNPELIWSFFGSDRHRDEFTIDDDGVLARYEAFARFFWPSPKAIVDRTGSVPHFLRMDLRDPMPRDATSKSLTDIMIERAAELLRMNAPLKVFWSGGVDSTAMIVALLLADADREQFEVVLTTASIREHPWFFRKVVYKLRFRIIGSADSQMDPHQFGYHTDLDYCRPDPRYFAEPADVWVTGELFNCLFGPLRIDTADGFRDASGTGQDAIPGQVADVLAPLLAASPRPMNDFADLLWFVMFTCSWVQHKYRFGVGLTHAPAAIIHFCDTVDFQRWALTGDEPKHADPRGRFSYKWPLKDFIYGFTKDEAYFAKGKKSSMPWENGAAKPGSPRFFRYLMEDGRLA